MDAALAGTPQMIARHGEDVVIAIATKHYAETLGRRKTTLKSDHVGVGLPQLPGCVAQDGLQLAARGARNHAFAVVDSACTQ